MPLGVRDKDGMDEEDKEAAAEQRCLFRPFTRESLAAIEGRIAEQNTRKKEDKERAIKIAAAAKDPDAPPIDDMYVPQQHDAITDPDVNLEPGMPLPKSIAKELPKELIATPLEDIDEYYRNKKVRNVLSLNFSLICTRRYVN